MTMKQTAQAISSARTATGYLQEKRLFSIMQREGVTVEALAEDLKTTPRTIRRKARRESEFTAGDLETIGKRLHMTGQELMYVIFC